MEKPRKIDALLISHRYDDECLLVTIPEIFENQSTGAFGSTDSNSPYQKEFLQMLDEISKHINSNALARPDMKRTVAGGA